MLNITRKKRNYTSYFIYKTITMNELLDKLKTKYPNLTLSRLHLGRVVMYINITLKQKRLRHVPISYT